MGNSITHVFSTQSKGSLNVYGGEFLVQGSLSRLDAPQAGWQMAFFQAPAVPLFVSSSGDQGTREKHPGFHKGSDHRGHFPFPSSELFF